MECIRIVAAAVVISAVGAIGMGTAAAGWAGNRAW
jgi:hypothetical protein